MTNELNFYLLLYFSYLISSTCTFLVCSCSNFINDKQTVVGKKKRKKTGHPEAGDKRINGEMPD